MRGAETEAVEYAWCVTARLRCGGTPKRNDCVEVSALTTRMMRAERISFSFGINESDIPIIRLLDAESLSIWSRLFLNIGVPGRDHNP
jgi:hypothetical protein